MMLIGRVCTYSVIIRTYSTKENNHESKQHTQNKYLTEQVRGSAAQDDGTGRAGLASTEPDQFVLAHHNLVDQRALTCKMKIERGENIVSRCLVLLLGCCSCEKQITYLKTS